MAVTITRTNWIDDDGSGTTGTVLNNAMKTGLYNEIDTALAKVAQLAGGNTFTGNQTIAGVLAATAAGNHQFVASNPAGGNSLTVQNSGAGTGAFGSINVGNDAAGTLMQLIAYSSTYSAGANAFNAPNSASLVASGVGGMSLVSINASASIRFFSGGFGERMRIAPTGDVLINAVTNSANAQVYIACDSSHPVNGLCIQNTLGAVMNFMVFSSSTATAGLIQQTSANTVAYTTSSDARLKDDDGHATDLSALRAVVVHDFRWKADGIRDRGVFAQEAHGLYPRAVSKGTDELTDSGDLALPWMTDYSKFVPDLIAGWQQHDAVVMSFDDFRDGIVRLVAAAQTEIAELRAALAAAKG